MGEFTAHFLQMEEFFEVKDGKKNVGNDRVKNTIRIV